MRDILERCLVHEKEERADIKTVREMMLKRLVELGGKIEEGMNKAKLNEDDLERERERER